MRTSIASPAAAGFPGPLTTVRVDHQGRLWVRGPLLFDGYLDDPGATADALVDGWYDTGDLAETDDEGYLCIVGRARDVIRTGGETVVPGEVEAVLGAMPALCDVAVVGLPDVEWGEVVCAVGGGRPRCGGSRLGRAPGRVQREAGDVQAPRRLVVVEEIPRTASTGQVQRRLLVDLVG